MTDEVAISALPDASLPLDGTELVPLVQSGTTSKAPASALGAGGGVVNQPITTGASPTDVTLYLGQVTLVPITTGGTAGNEVLNLATASDRSDVGQRVIIWLATRTNAGDKVNITVDSGGFVELSTPTLPGFSPTYYASGTDGIILDSVGQLAVMVNAGGNWLWDQSASTFGDLSKVEVQDIEITGIAANYTGNNEDASGVTIAGGDSAVNGKTAGAVSISAGEASGSNTGAGANVTISAGNANAGTAGDVSIESGVNGSAVRGNIKLSVLPTSDPGTPGALYAVAGVVHISL